MGERTDCRTNDMNEHLALAQSSYQNAILKKIRNQITNALWVQKFVSYFTNLCQSKNYRSKEQSHQTISTHNNDPPSSTHNDDPPQLDASLSKLHQRAN